jgi:hypothetical protein
LVIGQRPTDTQAFQRLWGQKTPTVSERLVVVPRQLGPVRLKQLRIIGFHLDWAQGFSTDLAEEVLTLPQRWDYFKLRWQNDASTQAGFELLQRAGRQVIHLPDMAEFQIWFGADGWDSYWSSRSKSLQKDLRKKLKRAEGLNPTFTRISDPAHVSGFLARFATWHVAHWEQQRQVPSLFSNPAELAFWQTWCRQQVEAGSAWLCTLYLDGQPCAMSIGMQQETTLYSLFSVTSGAHRELGPGLIALYLELQAAAAANIQMYNLGPGGTDYKARWANRQAPYQIALVPQSWLGHLLVNAKRTMGRSFI